MFQRNELETIQALYKDSAIEGHIKGDTENHQRVLQSIGIKAGDPIELAIQDFSKSGGSNPKHIEEFIKRQMDRTRTGLDPRILAKVVKLMKPEDLIHLIGTEESYGRVNFLQTFDPLIIAPEPDTKDSPAQGLNINLTDFTVRQFRENFYGIFAPGSTGLPGSELITVYSAPLAFLIGNEVFIIAHSTNLLVIDEKGKIQDSGLKMGPSASLKEFVFTISPAGRLVIKHVKDLTDTPYIVKE